MTQPENKGDLKRALSSTESGTSMKNYYKNKCVLFYCESFKSVALEIIKNSKGCVIEGEIVWEKFEDNSPKLYIKNAYHLRWSNVAFLADLSNFSRLFEQYAVMCELPKYLSKHVKIFIPYFPTGQMERIERYGEIATAHTLAKLLSNIPSGSQGATQLCICDIHTLQNRFYFNDNVLIRLETVIPLLLYKIKNYNNIIIAFPDDGAYKRFGKFFTDYKQIIMFKRRLNNNEEREITIKEGEELINDNNILIIDDLVQSGSTLISAANLLKKKNAKSISCYCTHPVFPNESWKKFCKNGKYEKLIDKFWITDTIPTHANLLKNYPPFELLSIFPVLQRVIYDDDAVIQVEH